MNKKRNLIQFLVIVFMVAVLTACMNNRDNKQGMDNQNRNMRNISTDENTGDNNNQDNRLDVADEAADQVVQLPEVRQANVIVTGNNAYVAAVLEDGTNGKLTKETEKKIADRVKSTDPDIKDVFVSTNPDFVDRVQKYVNDVQAGKPVKGFFEQFSEMVRRLFPTQR
ncbi:MULTISPECIES: YhcN/YlaJ family sporulation lipoprotein [unclassified Fictibacillus]|uniref:YhcN/YlaJ family sporulation lipoprotein n=1 Tax=unclassified Fictibacillus TaxID=2644029 RepID=UPI000782A1C4|nr:MULTISPECIES: YhcN/YlaJ family sporulation lipoprotein [unclassified Fictibacillus]MED2972423.1 YhcN/YlaJ family sporulation lipoprotein [Fictibacillus sp. B-59209]SFD63879.1 sporulation lipoprotein, YhcN/YlaJ family [Bacillus sp. OV194]